MGQRLAARATVVAVKVDGTASRYQIFALDREMFAVGTLNVKQVIEYPPFGRLTPLAQLSELTPLPAFIRGVLKRRDGVVPIIDLSARFGGRPSATGANTRILIVEAQSADVAYDLGIIVDTVAKATAINRGEASPPWLTPLDANFIFATGKIAGKSVIAIGLNELLSNAEVERLARVDAVPEIAAPALMH